MATPKPEPDGSAATDPTHARIALLLAAGFSEEAAAAWAEPPHHCSPEDLLAFALWWRDSGNTVDETFAWVDALGPEGMLWAPRWTAAGYTPEQATDLLAAGISVDEAISHWPAVDHHRNLDRLRLLAALRAGGNAAW